MEESLFIFEREFFRVKWKGLGGKGVVGIWVGEEVQSSMEMKEDRRQMIRGVLFWMVVKYDRT